MLLLRLSSYCPFCSGSPSIKTVLSWMFMQSVCVSVPRRVFVSSGCSVMLRALFMSESISSSLRLAGEVRAKSRFMVLYKEKSALSKYVVEVIVLSASSPDVFVKVHSRSAWFLLYSLDCAIRLLPALTCIKE